MPEGTVESPRIPAICGGRNPHTRLDTRHRSTAPLFALAGNPNTGKSSLFNALTGARQKVGNYPGVTVEKRMGRCRIREDQSGFWHVVDLPGLYALQGPGEERAAARSLLERNEAQVVVAVVDASNLGRNLPLVFELLDHGHRLVIALTMGDIARRRGQTINPAALEQRLGVPVVSVEGYRRRDLEALLTKVGTAYSGPRLTYPSSNSTDIHSRVETVLAGVFLESEHPGQEGHAGQELYKRTLSDHLDDWLTHRWLGLPLFLLLMFLLFQGVFTLAAWPTAWLENGLLYLTEAVGAFWPETLHPHLRSLALDGMLGGVGAVLSFLPNILLLFLGISILEDSGYVARAAFLLDRMMRPLGLQGKSFIPMLLGFGCSVPAIMSTRLLETRRERLLTMLIIPFLSCQARLPIYALLIPAFFPLPWRGTLLWGVYLLGILVAVVSARFLRTTLFRGESGAFLLELPPYRLPFLRNILLGLYERTGAYLKKAGTVIAALAVVMWALTQYPRPPEIPMTERPAISAESPAHVQADAKFDAEFDAEFDAMRYSFAGRIGSAIEPVFRPLGFDWRISTSLIGAFAAKEAFVAHLGVVHSRSNAEPRQLGLTLRERYSPLQAFSILLFLSLGLPCMATLAMTARESGAWRWAWLQVAMTTGAAWLLAMLAYQIGSRWLGL